MIIKSRSLKNPIQHLYLKRILNTFLEDEELIRVEEGNESERLKLLFWTSSGANFRLFKSVGYDD